MFLREGIPSSKRPENDGAAFNLAVIVRSTILIVLGEKLINARRGILSRVRSFVWRAKARVREEVG